MSRPVDAGHRRRPGHRRHRHPVRGCPAGLRRPRRGRGALGAQLRPGRARGARGRRRAQGRPVDRAADPRLPRAEGRRRRRLCPHEPARHRPVAPRCPAVPARVRRPRPGGAAPTSRSPSCAPSTSPRPSCSPRATAPRSTPSASPSTAPLADITTRAGRRLLRRPRRPAAPPVRALRGARHRARLHRGLPAWTRWPSARRRSSARCGARSRRAQRDGHVGPALNAVLQQALRVAKRVHTETAIDLVSGSLVQAGLARAEADARCARRPVGARRRGRRHGRASPRPPRPGPVPAPWSSPTATTTGPAASPSGSAARPCRCRELDEALAERRRRHLVAPGRRPGSSSPTTSRDGPRRPRRPPPGLRRPRAAARRRPRRRRPARRDPGGPGRARRRPRRRRLGPAGRRGRRPRDRGGRGLPRSPARPRRSPRPSPPCAPTPPTLVEEELRRLEHRHARPRPTPTRAEVRRAVQRVVDKLLHTPTVRVKELARDGQGGSYARALSRAVRPRPATTSSLGLRAARACRGSAE